MYVGENAHTKLQGNCLKGCGDICIYVKKEVKTGKNPEFLTIPGPDPEVSEAEMSVTLAWMFMQNLIELAPRNTEISAFMLRKGENRT